MYEIAIHLYLVCVAVASLFSSKVKKMWRGDRSAIATLRAKVDPNAKYVWVHAASLGEFEQGRPLMERIRREHPEYKILLTFFSPSGYEVRKDYPGADIVTYLPIDTRRNARRFLSAVHPVMAFFIKYEFWYNYLHILRDRHIPTYSISSIFRDEQVFFRWYGKGYANVLRCFTTLFVQNEVSRSLLARLGIDNVEVVGDTRFDRVVDIKHAARQLPVAEAFRGEKGTLVAGSSWEPDEEIFIPYFADRHDWQLIIAPHVIGESHLRKIEEQLAASHRKSYRYTQLAADYEKTGTLPDVAPGSALIIDCFGLLSSIYRYCDVAYVGGGFGVGIHNTLEAAVWGVPVIFGPNNQRFQEAQQLKACGGGVEIGSAAEFRDKMNLLLTDERLMQQSAAAAGHYVASRAGVLDSILRNIPF